MGRRRRCLLRHPRRGAAHRRRASCPGCRRRAAHGRTARQGQARDRPTPVWCRIPERPGESPPLPRPCTGTPRRRATDRPARHAPAWHRRRPEPSTWPTPAAASSAPTTGSVRPVPRSMTKDVRRTARICSAWGPCRTCKAARSAARRGTAIDGGSGFGRIRKPAAASGPTADSKGFAADVESWLASLYLAGERADRGGVDPLEHDRTPTEFQLDARRRAPQHAGSRVQHVSSQRSEARRHADTVADSAAHRSWLSTGSRRLFPA